MIRSPMKYSFFYMEAPLLKSFFNTSVRWSSGVARWISCSNTINSSEINCLYRTLLLLLNYFDLHLYLCYTNLVIILLYRRHQFDECPSVIKCLCCTLFVRTEFIHHLIVEIRQVVGPRLFVSNRPRSLPDRAPLEYEWYPAIASRRSLRHEIIVED